MMIDLPGEYIEGCVDYLVYNGYLPFFKPLSSWCVAGGFLRGMITNQKFTDIDVFIKGDKEHHTYNKNYRPMVDMIEVVESTPLERVKKFDFTCCMAAIGRGKDGKWWGKCHEKFVEHCKDRKLVLNEDWNGFSNWARIGKFLEQGWNISDTNLGRITRKLMLGNGTTEQGIDPQMEPEPPDVMEAVEPLLRSPRHLATSFLNTDNSPPGAANPMPWPYSSLR
jgi:hypothetical protein